MIKKSLAGLILFSQLVEPAIAINNYETEYNRVETACNYFADTYNGKNIHITSLVNLIDSYRHWRLVKNVMIDNGYTIVSWGYDSKGGHIKLDKSGNGLFLDIDTFKLQREHCKDIYESVKKVEQLEGLGCISGDSFQICRNH